MSIFNPQTREINCKIVYYGPALSGKTTSLMALQDRIKTHKKGRITKLPDTERTLFFDFLALSSPQAIRGFKTRFQVYTVPGQVLYEDARKLLLSGVDGIIFVADSRLEYIEDSIRSFEELFINLDKLDYDPSEIPTLIQYNRRDCPTAVRTEDLQRVLNRPGLPTFDTVASRGVGVMEAFESLLKSVMISLKEDA